MKTLAAARGARVARVPAQAKVNLRLRILARETSGYHQLETLFLRLALSDQVCVRITDGARSLDVGGDVDAALLGPTERNLAWRAAESYAALAGWPMGFAIELEKHIPIGGGLGGGSADAGAVLRALEALSPTPIGTPALLDLAAKLGADVPFLTSDFAFALGWGRGERLLGFPPPPQREVLMLLPAFSVNTAQAYGWLADAREQSASTGAVASMFTWSDLVDWESLASLAQNDFESVVAARHPEVSSLVGQLRATGCSIAMMSGSGSSVFGVLPSGRAVDVPRFTIASGAAAPRVVLTRTAARTESVVIGE